MVRKLIVTHHAPDLDAIGSTWLLKKFDTQHYGDAKIAFVNPGEQITAVEAEQHGVMLSQVVHVDTGLGEFDHHQPERARQHLSATSLVYDHILEVHPELKEDGALKLVVELITDIDHFGEVDWPDANHPRYELMIHQVIRGLEFVYLNDDDAQLHFGFTCLEGAYSSLKQHVRAQEIIEKEAQFFDIKAGRVMAVETRNDDTIKLAQKQGVTLVIRKDPEQGHIRIKARPDSAVELKPLHEAIIAIDSRGTWYYHPSGKMLVNGSRKHTSQTASPLSLTQIVTLVKELYA
jgi:hypothetical protein